MKCTLRPANWVQLSFLAFAVAFESLNPVHLSFLAFADAFESLNPVHLSFLALADAFESLNSVQLSFLALADAFESLKKFFAVFARRVRPPRFLGQVPLPRDFGILEGVGPRSELARSAFRKRFQI